MQGLWSFFQILSPEFAKCTLCGLELARGTSNANSFFGHLQNEHKEEWSKAAGPGRPKLIKTLVAQETIGDKIRQKSDNVIIEVSKSDAKISEKFEANLSEKTEAKLPENIEAKIQGEIEAKIPTKKLRHKKGKENLAPKDKKKNLNKLPPPKKKIVGNNKKPNDSLMEDLETKQITKFVCRKSEEKFVKPKLPETPVVPATERTRIQPKSEVPKIKPDMALEWNNFNIKFRVIDPDFQGRNDEFELYPNFSDTIAPTFVHKKRKDLLQSNTLNGYITSSLHDYI
jgi:hypothetical protein